MPTVGRLGRWVRPEAVGCGPSIARGLEARCRIDIKRLVMSSLCVIRTITPSLVTASEPEPAEHRAERMAAVEGRTHIVARVSRVGITTQQATPHCMLAATRRCTGGLACNAGATATAVCATRVWGKPGR